jgi:hypothetical protein
VTSEQFQQILAAIKGVSDSVASLRTRMIQGFSGMRTDLQALTATVQSPPPVDVEAVATAVVAKLPPQQAVPSVDDIAEAVADELARRGAE